eukprot:m.165689 g.165689  ORF g.165689 m.165689 type:complete len:532 (+) comp24982_c0_seq2:403-1998(+)
MITVTMILKSPSNVEDRVRKANHCLTQDPSNQSKSLLNNPCNQNYNQNNLSNPSLSPSHNPSPNNSNNHNTRAPHDLGGAEGLINRPLPTHDPPLQPWELECHAMFSILATKKVGGVTTDQLRRAIEALDPEHYINWSYYEKWSAAMAQLLTEGGTLKPGELERELFADDFSNPNQTPRFVVGDKVQVRRRENRRTRWRRPHLRTPGYLYGRVGDVTSYLGAFTDPSFAAYGVDKDVQQHLYRVQFDLATVWPERGEAEQNDVVEVEIFENWLVKPGEQEEETVVPTAVDQLDQNNLPDHSGQGHSHHHHEEEADHVHLSRPEVEENAVNLQGPPCPGEALHQSLKRLLVEKNFLDLDALRSVCEKIEAAGARLDGATLVARAWVDDDFRQRLVSDAAAAAKELGINTSNPNAPTILTVVENTPQEHNLIVCTLCSCYPSSVLGPSPAWYRSREFRARAVRAPRAMLKDTFGFEIEPNRSIRVHDSTAECRFMVLPRRPDNTEGWTEQQLRELITRDSMLGVSEPKMSSEN